MRLRGRRSIAGMVAGVFALLSGTLMAQPDAEYDVLIRGGEVLDGTGSAAFTADVGVRDGRIVAVGSLAQAKARTVVDAKGKYVTPGFIDVHSHAGEGLSEDLNHGRPVLAQGITTVAVNPDGGGPVDIAAQRATYENRGIGPNAAIFVPHGSIRRQVLGRPTARRTQPN